MNWEFDESGPLDAAAIAKGQKSGFADKNFFDFNGAVFVAGEEQVALFELFNGFTAVRSAEGCADFKAGAAQPFTREPTAGIRYIQIIPRRGGAVEDFFGGVANAFRGLEIVTTLGQHNHIFFRPGISGLLFSADRLKVVLQPLAFFNEDPCSPALPTAFWLRAVATWNEVSVSGAGVG